MSNATITLLVLAAAVVLFVLDRVPVAVVAMLVPMALWLSGVLDLSTAFAGFGDPTTLFIGALFVVSEALTAAGVTAWVGDLAMRRAGEGRTRLLVTIMIMVAVLTALITPNGSIAALTMVIVSMALRAKRSPSELLLPAAFAAHAGSLLMITGSPVTVVVADYVEEVSGNRLNLFSLALIGVPLLILTAVVSVLFGARLVPERSPQRLLHDFGRHGETLREHYALDGVASEMTRTEGVAEFIVPPRSRYIGDRIHPGMLSESGDLVLAAHQRGHDLGRSRKVVHSSLAAGDRLLLRGPWPALERAAQDPEIIAVDDPDEVRRQAVPRGRGAKRALGVLLAMVVLLATGVVPAAAAGIAAGVAMVLLRVLTVDQAYRGISWTTLILIGGMMSLSAAMVDSGAAALVATGLVEVIGQGHPLVLLAGLFLITSLLGQLISNMATALIVIPIGISAAQTMGISPVPVLISIGVFAAGALLTPVATPANLMVAEAGGYRFGDYWKLGLPLLLCYGVAGIFLVPLIWPF